MDCDLFWKNPNSIKNIRQSLTNAHDNFVNFLPADQSELAEQRKALQECNDSLPATNAWEIFPHANNAIHKPPAMQSKKNCHHPKEVQCECVPRPSSTSSLVQMQHHKERVCYSTLPAIDKTTVCCKAQNCLQTFSSDTIEYLRQEFWKQAGCLYLNTR
jgi:hypothetical protein